MAMQNGEPVDVLAATLVKAVLELGRAGQPQRANRLAAVAYAAVRHDHPDATRRLNGVMHSLARMESPPPPQRSETETSMPQTIDVRPEPPVRRHALIFETFDTLPVDDNFELVNDHDPKPLYYQLEAEQTGKFTWEYLEEGPEVWRVRIGRTAA